MRIFACIPLIVLVALLLLAPVQAGTVDDGHCVVGAIQGSATWYFAEGCTRPGFNTYLCLGNPNDKAVNARVTYYLGNSTTKSKTCPVPARSRNTLLLNNESDVGFRSDNSGDVSIKVESMEGLPIIAERPMYFDGNYAGGHDVLGSPALSQEWYFAEGYTGSGFDEWVCVLNPGNIGANLTFRFQTQDAGEITKPGLSVAAHSRQTFKVNDLLGANFQTSLKLESTQPIVAERSIYFDYTGMGAHHWQGGHCVMGATTLAKEYYLAEGCTRYPNFEEWLTLQNPNPETITVEVTYQFGPGQGDPAARSYDVPGNYRYTVYLENEVGRDKDVSVRLTSKSPFLAERPMYFQYQYGDFTVNGGHCVIGANKTASEWYFAEGYTGSGFNEWLCLQNPGDDEANVIVNYLPQGSASFARTHSIPAHSRYTVMVNNDAGADRQLSCNIKSGTPIVAERPMYFAYGMAEPPPPPQPQPTPQPTPAPTPSPTPSPAPTPAPQTINLSGHGDTATSQFRLEKGLSKFLMTHNGSSNFYIWLYDQNGKRIDLLVNEIGAFNGSTALGIDPAMNYMLNITADGSWTVTIEQPRPTTAPSLPQTYTGSGCQVSNFFYSGGGLVYFDMSHNGSSNFIIWLLDKDGNLVDLLANEIGSYSGSKAVSLDPGIYLLNITADGNWSVNAKK